MPSESVDPRQPDDPQAAVVADPPRHGTLFLVVGPSGVGKDTLIDAAREALADDPRFVFAQRVITRPADAGGETHEAMAPAEFEAARAAGAFAVAWSAHSLSYGVRTAALTPLAEGRDVIVNASRRSIAAFRAVVPSVVILSITAPAEVVRRRLEARGREDAADVAARLARDIPLTGLPDVATVDNGGDVAAGTRAFIAALLRAGPLP